MSLEEKAAALDAKYKTFKEKFAYPTYKSMGISDSEKRVVYFCGNSLGLMPCQTRQYIKDELDNWSQKAVEAHFDHPKTEWMNIDLPVVPLLAPLVGAKENEVGVMSTLTSNLNNLMTVFYKPKGRKSKILFEKGAFPSDYYAFLNQVKLHESDIGAADFNPTDYLLQLSPRSGSYNIQTSDILKAIDENHEDIAVICLPGIQYYSGQYFEIEKITSFAKKYNITVGWDLAHAVGNVMLKLHEWDVDFAAWCSYKYLNCGPGAIGGYFIHEKHSTNKNLARPAGWWGNDERERFQMKEVFNPISSALGFRQSNPSVLDVVCVQSSLDLLQSIVSSGNTRDAMSFLREKAVNLTNLLEEGLKSSEFYVAPENTFASARTSSLGFTIVTPSDPQQRGSQLSLLFFPSNVSRGNVMEIIFNKLRSHGVIGDERRPNVIRLAPVPLYSTFEDVIYVCAAMEAALKQVSENC